MRSSPFAALTGEEKQIKWLEVQSIRLPYVHTSADVLTAEEESEKPPTATSALPPDKTVKASPKRQNQPASAPALHLSGSPAAGQEKRTAPSGFTAGDFLATRHRQYDAVIARMKQAEQSARQYQPL